MSAMELSIEAQKRDTPLNPRALRREGLIPAVLYGHNGSESISLVVDTREAQRLVRYAFENKTLVNLSVPHLPWTGRVLLREVQKHPWKDELHHISFYAPGAAYEAASDAADVAAAEAKVAAAEAAAALALAEAEGKAPVGADV